MGHFRKASTEKRWVTSQLFFLFLRGVGWRGASALNCETTELFKDARQLSDMSRFMDGMRWMKMGCEPVRCGWPGYKHIQSEKKIKKEKGKEKQMWSWSCEPDRRCCFDGFECGVLWSANAGRLSNNPLSHVKLRINYKVTFGFWLFLNDFSGLAAHRGFWL